MKTASVLALRIPNQYHSLILLIKEQKPPSEEMRLQHLKSPHLYRLAVYFFVYLVLVIIKKWYPNIWGLPLISVDLHYELSFFISPGRGQRRHHQFECLVCERYFLCPHPFFSNIVRGLYVGSSFSQVHSPINQF